MEWMGNEYRLIAKSRCVSLCDLIAAACEAGIKVGVPLSLAEATHALGSVYHGEEMLFDGAYQGLAQAYCVDRPWDEDTLRDHMGDVPSHLYNYQWWNDRSIDGIPEVLYVANKSLVRKDDAKAIWGRICEFLFDKTPGDLEQFIGKVNAARATVAPLQVECSGLRASHAGQPPPTDGAVSVTLPHLPKALAAVFLIMRNNWTDYDPKRPPKQVNIAREIDTAIGWKAESDGAPSRNAKTIAALIKPDAINDTE